MKKFLPFLLAVIAFVGFTPKANAEFFSFGPKVGTNINSLKFDKKILDSDNRVGYNFGVMAEFMLPVANLGFDVSVMYVRRNARFFGDGDVDAAGTPEVVTINSHRDYFEIPLNLKWKISLPVVGSLVSPYIFTGPSFAFLTSKKTFKGVTNSLKDNFNNKSFDVAWNFGLGVQIVKKVQVSASYGIGLSKALEFTDKVANATGGLGANAQTIQGKNRYWTLTAAYLFSL